MKRTFNANGKQDYQTPPELADVLRKVCLVDTDGAASAGNSITERYFGEGGVIKDAFDADFTDVAGHVIYVNPPYKNLGPWVEMFQQWGRWGAMVYALLPAQMSAGWFHDGVLKKAGEINFIKGRIAFVNPGNRRARERKPTGLRLCHLRTELKAGGAER